MERTVQLGIALALALACATFVRAAAQQDAPRHLLKPPSSQMKQVFVPSNDASRPWLTDRPLGGLRRSVVTMQQNLAAQKLKNPAPGDPKSIANGKDLYEKNCTQCHGDMGKGDGMMAADLQFKPPDLTDPKWDHGSTDGEIFAIIRDGSKKGMLPMGRKLATRAIWDLVNYVRTLGPKPKKKRVAEVRLKPDPTTAGPPKGGRHM